MTAIQRLWERIKDAFEIERDDGQAPAPEITRPYPNEHACRLEDPGKYDTCRRGSRTADKPDSVKGKEYAVIYCKKGDGPMEQQAFRYPVDSWTAEQARAHCDYSDGSFEAAKKEEKAAEHEQPLVWRLRSSGWTYLSYDGGATWSSYKGEVEVISERGMSIFDLADQVQAKLGGDYWINDLYVEDDGAISAILSGGGKLYKVAVTVAGGEVAVAEPVEVQIEYTPRAARRGLQIMRQADGKCRWFAITEAAVLLRSPAEIDSRALFDDFLANIPEYGYPELRFYHDSRLVMGVADWAAREDALLLASGLLADNDLGRAMAASSERGDVVWGVSNGYEHTEAPELWEVSPGITIPVYKRGIWREISVLPEERAASLYTAISSMEVTRMRAEVADALKKLFADETRATDFIAGVDATNREIVEQGLITRGEEPKAEPETVPPAATEERTEYEMSEETVTAIAQRVRESLPPPATMPDLAPLESALRAATERLAAIDSEIALLKRTDEEKRQAWVADLPARTRLNVTYRPREEHKADASALSLADIAKQTLSQMG